MHYILDGHAPVKVADVLTWAKWFETADRRVARTALAKDVEVSTVFLGIDYSPFSPGFPPILFETMVFGGKHDGDMRRYATWDEAEIGHAEECARVLREIRSLVQGEVRGLA